MTGGGKRPRYDDDGQQIKQLELELELARLRREEAEQRQANAEQTPGQAEEPGTSGQSSGGTSTSTPQSAAAPLATTTAAPPPATPQQQLPRPQMPIAQHLQANRGRGRVQGRGIGQTNRSLATVFVCTAHDNLFCQTCNFYEKSGDYWDRR